jgi:hypothetical protein
MKAHPVVIVQHVNSKSFLAGSNVLLAVQTCGSWFFQALCSVSIDGDSLVLQTSIDQRGCVRLEQKVVSSI